jgi:AraC-like DNA-binding protein
MRSATLNSPLPENWRECVRGENIAWENRRVRSELVCLGEVMYQPGGTCGPRIQRDWQLVFLHSGELVASVDGQRKRLAPGEVGLFLPGRTEVFEFSTSLPTHHSWCAVAPNLLSTSLEKQLRAVSESHGGDQVEAGLLASGLALGRADSELAQGLVDQIGLALLGAYVNAGTARAAGGVVDKAIRHMEQHLGDEQCLLGAHMAAGVSRNTLISRFKAELGVTPAKYLWRLRAERGVAMLAETGLTIGEIAYACGFGDPSHFSRLVKELQGASPQALRNKSWSTNGKPARGALGVK